MGRQARSETGAPDGRGSPEPELMVKCLDTGQMISLESATGQMIHPRVASSMAAAKRLTAAEEQLLLPASLVPTITRLAFSGAPIVGAQVSIEPTFSISGCTHVTRWRRLRATREKSADDEADSQDIVGTGASYLVTADDLGCVLVAELAPAGPTGARGLAGTATTGVVTLAPQLHVQLVAALTRTSAYFDMELVSDGSLLGQHGTLSGHQQGRAASEQHIMAPPYAPSAAAMLEQGARGLPLRTRRVRLLLGADGVHVRALGRADARNGGTAGGGGGRQSRRNAVLVSVGYSPHVRVRAPPAEPRRLLLSLVPGEAPLELLASSPAERTTAVITIRAFACLGNGATTLGALLWPEAGAEEAEAWEGQLAQRRVRAPAVGGHVSFSGQPLVGSTLYVHLPSSLTPPQHPQYRQRGSIVSIGGGPGGNIAPGRRVAGGVNGESAVRSLQITWRRSRANAPLLAARRGAYAIEGATGISYCLTADDVGCLVMADVAPIGADGTGGICAFAMTHELVGLPPELAERLEAARETGEARFAALDVSALAAASLGDRAGSRREVDIRAGGKQGAGGAESGAKHQGFGRAMQASLARTVAGSWIGHGEPPGAERTLLVNSRKSKLRYGRRTLAKEDLNEATDARIGGASEAQTVAVAAAIGAVPADSAAAELLRQSVPMCVRMSPALAFDLLMPSARERDAAALVLRMFARERCEQLGLKWWGVPPDTDSDSDGDDDGVDGEDDEGSSMHAAMSDRRRSVARAEAIGIWR